ncbi:DegV family protein [Bacillus sp. AFS017336]|uniref:DegV family protein n=1 Tax=Bacillaceae TaxID=186817 RepID=UPI000BF03648|nr:DegV family protein [Bacillus sp. AFS017336]PEK99916.1 fatty acid-binding protein DegV [Bacillus sp. AFS017336]QKE75740.1 DegV family protein [Arthrobacter citreus]
MANIKIVTDSTADLLKEEIENLNITVIPLSIQINGETYIDGVTISPKEFIDKMQQTVELPKTSQPAVGTFVETFEKLTADGSKVISIHLSSGLSGTYSTACVAAGMVEGDVTVIDSAFITRAMAFQVIEAAKMAEDGSTKEEIVKRITEIKNNSYLYIMVDTLENLVKGGRIGKGKAFIGSLLNIKPIASLDGGVYSPVGKVRSHPQVVKTLTKYFEQDTNGKTIKGVGIAHADAPELADALRNSIQQFSNFELDKTGYTTPVISTHTGKGAIGFVFYAE